MHTHIYMQPHTHKHTHACTHTTHIYMHACAPPPQTHTHTYLQEAQEKGINTTCVFWDLLLDGQYYTVKLLNNLLPVC